MNLTDSPPSSIPLTKQILWGLPLPSQSLFNIKPWLLVEQLSISGSDHTKWSTSASDRAGRLYFSRGNRESTVGSSGGIRVAAIPLNPNDIRRL